MEAPRVCSMCGVQEILYRPESRTVCAGCERGRYRPTHAHTSVGEIDTRTDGMVCSRDGCTRSVLPLEDPDWDQPPMSREERQRLGRRTECWHHYRESNRLVGRYLILPGQGIKQEV